MFWVILYNLCKNGHDRIDIKAEIRKCQEFNNNKNSNNNSDESYTCRLVTQVKTKYKDQAIVVGSYAFPLQKRIRI